MNLRKKKILITAGPTWVPIDKIRVISNIATGRTGVLLAKEAKRYGADVTLLIGPNENVITNNSIKAKSFRYFNDFKDLFIKELKRNYDAVIHSAAVSDYQPKRSSKSKLKSDLKRLSLSLVLTPKLVDRVKRFNPNSYLVIFKLEMNVSKKTLIERAYSLLKHTKADLVVANTFDGNSYRAFIVDKNKTIIGSAQNKERLVRLLIEKVRKEL